MESLILNINEQIELCISKINDRILTIQTIDDIDAIDERLTALEQFQEFLKASNTMLSRYCAAQRICIDEQRANLGLATQNTTGSADGCVQYMENLTGSLVGYQRTIDTRDLNTATKKPAALEKLNTANTTQSAVQNKRTTQSTAQNKRTTQSAVQRHADIQNVAQDFKVVQFSQIIQLPACSSLQNIIPALQVYDNQLYMCVYPGLYCRVPYPTTIDTNAADDRQRTVRCRALTRQACNERRRFVQQPCKYAHCGERIIKVSSAGRCLSCPTFGNPESWAADVAQATERDIRTVLMYGLSDIVAVACWAASKKIKGIWHDLDVA